MIGITNQPIDVYKLMKDCRDESAGATVFFSGSIRDHNEKGKVIGIYYEAYVKMAKNTLMEIEREVHRKWDVKKFVAIHRIGNLMVNEISVAVGVATEHRHDAFEACKYTIDSIKARTPIWKKELSDSGNETWKNGILPFNIERNLDNENK
jgi:molybdopterin synthase catalytic subunit